MMMSHFVHLAYYTSVEFSKLDMTTISFFLFQKLYQKTHFVTIHRDACITWKKFNEWKVTTLLDNNNILSVFLKNKNN